MKTRKKVILLIFAIIIIMACLASRYGNHENDDLKGRTAQVTWAELNIRETPNGEVIAVLEKGFTVVMTGKTYEFIDAPNPLWIEVIHDDTTGWVVREAIKSTG